MTTDDRPLLPTTEAGRALLVGLPWTNEREKEAWARLIDAIEAEAREKRAPATFRLAREIAVAAERERIEQEVDGLGGKPSGVIVTGTCYVHRIEGCHLCRPKEWKPDGDVLLSRAAVLAIVRGEEAGR